MGWEDGGRFRREGTYVSLWLIYVDVWQKPTQYYKAIVLQLKINLKKKGCSFIKKKRSPLSLGEEFLLPYHQHFEDILIY